MSTAAVGLRWYDAPAQVDDVLREQLAGCWTRVSDAGGAVGFPHPPVSADEVRAATHALVEALSPRDRLLVARVGAGLAGWLLLSLNAAALTAHWATVTRVQTDLPHRGAGVGRALMTEVAGAAAGLGLQQLHIEMRGGAGLEPFYARLGWVEVGRWPAALRLADGDDRDEVLMVLRLPR